MPVSLFYSWIILAQHTSTVLICRNVRLSQLTSLSLLIFPYRCTNPSSLPLEMFVVCPRSQLTLPTQGGRLEALPLPWASASSACSFAVGFLTLSEGSPAAILRFRAPLLSNVKANAPPYPAPLGALLPLSPSATSQDPLCGMAPSHLLHTLEERSLGV